MASRREWDSIAEVYPSIASVCAELRDRIEVVEDALNRQDMQRAYEWEQCVESSAEPEVPVISLEQAYSAGADAELDACCEYVSNWFADPAYRVSELRNARRPGPGSAKSLALEKLKSLLQMGTITQSTYYVLLRGLEDA